MKLQVYTVFDRAVSAYLPPFYVRAKGEAIRSFTEACSDPQKNFGKYAQDYGLVYLGEFDDSSGIFTCSDPVRVLSATECMVEVDTPTVGIPSTLRGNGGMPA